MADTETPLQRELGERGMPDPGEEHAPHAVHPSAKEYIRIGSSSRSSPRSRSRRTTSTCRASILIPTLYVLAL